MGNAFGGKPRRSFNFKSAAIMVISGTVGICTQSLAAGSYKLAYANNSGYSDVSQLVAGAGRSAAGYGRGTATAPSVYGHAVFWPDISEEGVDLHPTLTKPDGSPFYEHSYVFGMDAGAKTQVGACVTNDNYGYLRPFLWNGTAKSATDLTPAGMDFGICYAANGSIQVGSVSGPNVGYHASVWSGSASSFVDINPSGMRGSIARATDGTRKVGCIDPYFLSRQPGLWSSTNVPSMLPLPSTNGITNGDAWAIEGNVVGGQGFGDNWGETHALLWNLSSNSVVDLHPTGWFSSTVNAVSSSLGIQVGWGTKTDGGAEHALLWRGSAASVIDLGVEVGVTGGGANQAGGIDSVTGNIYGYLGNRAAVWMPIPEPATASVVFLAAACLVRQRRCCRV